VEEKGEGFAAEGAPKREVEVEVAGAPNGEGGAASFFSVVDAPNENAGVAAGAPKGLVGAGEGAPNENEGTAAATGAAAAGFALVSPSSSSIPLSPASSMTEEAFVAERPKTGAGVESFFSSALGVAGVALKLNVGAAEAGAEAVALPKENDGAMVEVGLSAAGLGAAEKEKGEAAGVEVEVKSVAGLAAPKAKTGAAGVASVFFCWCNELSVAQVESRKTKKEKNAPQQEHQTKMQASQQPSPPSSLPHYPSLLQQSHSPASRTPQTGSHPSSPLLPPQSSSPQPSPAQQQQQRGRRTRTKGQRPRAERRLSSQQGLRQRNWAWQLRWR
jgi:hypothetical protein